MSRAELQAETSTLKQVAKNLWEMLDISPYYGDFEGVNLKDGWAVVENHDSIDPITIVACNTELGLFAKIYAPCAKEYAKKAYKGHKALSELTLSSKILPPIGFESSIIFFKLGKHCETTFYSGCFRYFEMEIIASTLNNLGLKELSFMSSRVEIIDIEGELFVADPFDDSPNAVFKFIHGNL